MRYRCSPWLLTLLLWLLLPAVAQAEGSRELTNNSGNRPYLEDRDPAVTTTAGITRSATFNVVANDGEQINLGSSANGLGNGQILVTPPGGTEQACSISEGIIFDRTDETAGPVGTANGGYEPCIFEVDSTNAGTWQVRFTSPDDTRIGPGSNPTPTTAAADWSSNRPNAAEAQDDTVPYIAAWEISVTDRVGAVGSPQAPSSLSDIKTGRVYSSYLPLNGGSTSAPLQSETYVLTDEGYQYRIDFNGIQPFGFILFSNNNGFVDNNGPTFRSIQFDDNQLNNTTSTAGNFPSPPFHSPELTDTSTNTTHRIFFNEADSTEFNTTAATPPDPTNFEFVGEEGTSGQAGTAPSLDGNFVFDSPVADATYTITLSDSSGTVLRVLRGRTVSGTNTVAWDGLDSEGNAVPAGDIPYDSEVSLAIGEAHFPLLDPENNPNGLIIEVLNPPSTSQDPFLVYFDNENTANGDDAPVCTSGETVAGGSTPSNGTRCYGTVTGDREAILGTNSSGGTNVWSNNFGDLRGIDTWVNSPGESASSTISLKEADLQVTKAVSSSTVAVGESLTYTITASNGGPTSDGISGITITDQVPTEIDSSSLTVTCTVPSGSSATCGSETDDGNGLVTMVTGDLPANSSLEYTITGTVISVGSGSIANDAFIERPNDVTDPDCVDCNRSSLTESETNNRDSIATTITPSTEADLEIVKTVSGTDNGSGYDLTYTLVVTNNGTGDVTNATVTDTLDSQLTGLTVSCDSSPSSNCVSQSIDGSNNLSTTVTLANGESATYTITGQVADTVTGTLANTAQVATPSGITDPDTTNNESSASISLPLEADLSLTKDVATTVGATDTTLTYTIVVTNNGPGDVTGATVTDTIPGDVTGVTWTCAASTTPTATCGDDNGSGNSINTTVDLPSGGTATYTVTGTVANSFSGTVTNAASTAPPSGITDPDTSNNDDAETVTLPLEADLSLTKDVATAVGATDTTLTYTITVTNDGPSGVTGATVTDTIPGDVTGVTWTCAASTAPTATCGDDNGSGNSINTTVDLPSGGTATYTVTGTVANSFSGSVTNAASTAPPNGVTDPDSSNNDDAETVNLPIGSTDVTIAKTGASSFSLGADVSFVITVENTGSVAALNVQVDDTTPTGLTFISNSDDCTTTFVCDLGDIPAGESRTITTTFNVPSDYTGSDPITNTATVSLDNDADTTNNTATTDVPLILNPSLILVKRITDVTRNGTSLTGVDFSSFVDDASDTNDNTINDATIVTPVGVSTVPSTIVVQSGDIVEYTVYFLSNGDADLTNAQICDAIPSGTTFVAGSMAWFDGTGTNSLTDTTGDDEGEYITPLTPVSSPCSPTNNPNGSVLVTFATLAVDEVGYIRFQVQVD
ncbi:MAG: hypothetical protein AAGG51_10105 [Cyanobacteria bacterium P01_G01_bin.54]